VPRHRPPRRRLPRERWCRDPGWVADNLAAGLLATRWEADALTETAVYVLEGVTEEAARRLVTQLMRAFVEPYPPPQDDLRAEIASSARFKVLFTGSTRERPRVGAAILAPPRFAPAPRFAALDVPRLTTPGDLAAWLGVGVAHLDWYADAGGWRAATPDPALRHYVYAWAEKRSGAPRLIEAPKLRLKAMQRRILRAILDPVPVHGTAFGFVKGRSCLGAAQAHAGEAVVIALDLKDFFPSLRLSRVHGLFRSLGYPHAVARLLTGLCSTATPRDILDALPPEQRHPWPVRKLLLSPHLPQGAPTSPALANLTCFALDTRLAGLARRFDARYTRYADDLAFSGWEVLAGRTDALLRAAELIVREEGHAIGAVKRRVMRAHRRQQVTGIVVNRHVNVPRADYDRLKATLTNCVRRGPAHENRSGHADFRAHLDGRVQWVESLNPVRGAKLRALLDRIAW